MAQEESGSDPFLPLPVPDATLLRSGEDLRGYFQGAQAMVYPLREGSSASNDLSTHHSLIYRMLLLCQKPRCHLWSPIGIAAEY
jgi:hypothetical protein